MAQTPDIKIIIGAQKTQTKVQIRSDLTDIVNQINNSKSFPRIKMGLDIAKTKVQIKSDLKNILSGITLNDVKLDLGGGKQISASVQKQINDVKKMLNFSDVRSDNGFATQLKTIQNQIKGIITQKPQLQSVYNELAVAGSRLRQLNDQLTAANPAGVTVDETYLTKNKVLLDQLSDAYNNYFNILSREKSLYGERSTFVTQANKMAQTKRSLDSLITSISKYEQYNDKFRKNSGFAANFDSIKERAQQMFAAMGSGAEVDEIKVQSLTREFVNLTNAISQADMKGQTGWTKIKEKISQYGIYLSGAAIFSTALTQAKKMVSTVADLDAAMTELRKVTDETDVTYNKFFNNAIERSQRLGATLVDTINASSDMARLGYSLKDASALADTALVYKNVADGLDDIGTASDNVISAMKAFNISAKDSMSIADKYNEVSNHFSLTAADIGTAMQKSASALKEGGNTIDQSIGMIVAANNVTRDADVTGTALKTLSLRIRGAKASLEDMGESTDDLCSSTSELQQKLIALTGVDIMKDKNTFKSTYEIMQEMSKVWNNLTDINKASAMELMGGKRQANVLSSLLSTFQDAEAAAKTSAESMGSALQENSVYLNSINGRVSQFKSTYEALSATIVNDDLIKNVVSSGTSLLNILNNILKVTGSFPTAISAIVAAYASAKNIGISKMKYALPHPCGAVA